MNTRRKLLLFGKRGGSPGQSLFDAYKARVEADSGVVQDEAATLELFQNQILAGIRSKTAFQISAQAGNRLPSGGVNKAYSLDENNSDAVEDTASLQVPLSSTPPAYSFDNHQLQVPSIPVNSFSIWANMDSVNSTQYFIGFQTAGIRYNGSNFLGFYQDTNFQTLNHQSSGWSLYYFEKKTDFLFTLYVNNIMIGDFGEVNSGFSGATFDVLGQRIGVSLPSKFPINDIRIFSAPLTPSERTLIYDTTKATYGIS